MLLLQQCVYALIRHGRRFIKERVASDTLYYTERNPCVAYFSQHLVIFVFTVPA